MIPELDAFVLMHMLLEEPKVYKALQTLVYYGQVDGSHHKMWAIDQAVRMLLGERYDEFVKLYENNGEYSWDVGIAP